MATAKLEPSIDEYLRKRLMPVEGAIPQVAGIEMYGNSVPAGTVGGDLFEYINFQQRYNIEGRIAAARLLSEEYLQPLAEGQQPRTSVDEHIVWLKSRPDFDPSMETAYRQAKSSEQVRIAENLEDFYATAGVLVVDAQGHGIISAKIASTVHDTFHAFILSELDLYGKVTASVFEKINLRLAQSVTARNALGRSTDSTSREVATMLYGEITPDGNFRFINFGHPVPRVFSTAHDRFMPVDQNRMVQRPPLGWEVPDDHPDSSKYISLIRGKRQMNSSDVAEINLIDRGDIIVLHSDGVYDGFDEAELQDMEAVIRENKDRSAKEICNAIMDYAISCDAEYRKRDEADRIDDKTVFVIKRN